MDIPTFEEVWDFVEHAPLLFPESTFNNEENMEKQAARLVYQYMMAYIEERERKKNES